MGDSHLPPEYLALATTEKSKNIPKTKQDTAQSEPVLLVSSAYPSVSYLHALN